MDRLLAVAMKNVMLPPGAVLSGARRVRAVSHLMPLVWLALFLQISGAALGVTPTPAFVQERDNQVTSGSTNSVTFSKATSAGNLIAVYLIWDSTGTASVSDSLHNAYAPAAAPLRWSNGTYSNQVFYAISSGGADTVTATFSTKVRKFGIVYAHEYSGINAAAPVDVTSSAVGTSGALSSGTASTTNAIDLLFAGGVSANVVTSPGSGFTARSKSQGNITEDAIVTSKGMYAAVANNSGGAWGMQMVAFRGGSSSDTTPPTVPSGLGATALSPSQINLSWNASSDAGTAASQITYSVHRGGTWIGTTSGGVTSWSDSPLAPSTTYSYTVTASDPAGNSSGQSTAAQATTLPLQDTVPPTIPANLSVPGTSTTTASLAWTSSTDNVGVAGYRIYRGGAQVGTSGATAFIDSGLAPGTTYTYTVSAYDGAGNSSAQSAPAGATTKSQDSQGPTVSITAPANNQTVSGSAMIAANASDSTGVAGVQFLLDGGNVGAEVTSAPYSLPWDTTQATNGSHQISAIARDAAGNRATAPAMTVTVNNNSTGKPYSTTFPLAENPISEGGNWTNGKSDGVDWGDVRTTPGLAFGTNSGNFADSTAILDGNWGPDQMAQATVHSVNQTDNLYEEVELRLRSTITPHRNSGYEINFRCSKTGNAYSQIVRWNGALGDFTYLWGMSGSQYGVANGDVVKATMVGNVITTYINGKQVGQVTDNTYSTGNPGMGFYLAGTTGVNSDYGFTNFNASDSLNGDTTPPSLPQNLGANAVSSSQINLNWSASSDNVAVTGYKILRNNTQIATATSPSFADKAAAPGVSYSYTVAAYDAAGNVSQPSSPVTAQTSSGSSSDTTPPLVPVNLAASKVTSSSLTVSWSPSTDDVGVAGYQIFRNGTQVGTSAAPSFADSGLATSTTYSYTVAAYDGSGNTSVQSQAVLATTAASASTAPSIVQTNQNQTGSGTSTSVSFNAPTAAGNTIVAYVIWSNTGSAALSDSRGDNFVAVGPAVPWGNGYCAQVFYASSIAGGSDTVTATFRTGVTSFGVLYVHEYSGISNVNPVDVTVSASGSSSTLNSGTATTTSANDLIFGAGVSDNVVTAVGSGFSSRDLSYGNVTEDRTAANPGSYSAGATHNGKTWGMQMVAFRAAQ